MTMWNELPAHLVSKIRSDSVTAPANLPGAVPALKYGNAITEVDGIRFDSRKEAKYYEDAGVFAEKEDAAISLPGH